MASGVAVPWQEVLDDVDEGTAFLLLKLQLDDIEEQRTVTNASPNGQHTNDSDLARSFLQNDLELYRATRWYNKDEPNTSDAVIAPVRFCCVICEDYFDSDHVWQLPCEHWYCDKCLNELFETAMTVPGAYPPRCCRGPVDFEEARISLDDKLAAIFANKKEELDDIKPLYCSDPGCFAFIGQQGKEGQRATCLKCGHATCRLCKKSMHTGECPDDVALRQALDLAEIKEWRRCFSCENMVEISSGCNHMTCVCRAQFCYECGARWKTCECPQFTEDRLLERGQEIVDRDGGWEIDAIIDDLQRHHDCVRHNWVSRRGSHQCETCDDIMPTFIYRCNTCHTQRCRRCRFTRA